MQYLEKLEFTQDGEPAAGMHKGARKDAEAKPGAEDPPPSPAARSGSAAGITLISPFHDLSHRADVSCVAQILTLRSSSPMTQRSIHPRRPATARCDPPDALLRSFWLQHNAGDLRRMAGLANEEQRPAALTYHPSYRRHLQGVIGRLSEVTARLDSVCDPNHYPKPNPDCDSNPLLCTKFEIFVARNLVFGSRYFRSGLRHRKTSRSKHFKSSAKLFKPIS